MSEPLTSHEIEDVLSSIRRLVSEDLRPARAAAPEPEGKAPPAAAPEPDKLLLTPALRVVSAEEAQETAPAAAEPGPAWPEPETAGLADLAPGAAPAPAVAEKAAPAEPEPAPGITAFSPPQEVYDDAGMEDAVPAFMGGEDEIIWASAGEAEDASGMVEDLVEPPAEPAPTPRGHWTAQDLPDSVDWVQEETDWVETDPIPFVAHPRKPDLTAEPLARAWADSAEAAVQAELEQVAAGIAEAVVSPAPEPEPEAKLETQPDEAPEDDTVAQGLFDREEPLLDEEKLREIVRDIIREELAGTLGERITRNVRKLVRVEINRALAAREFE